MKNNSELQSDVEFAIHRLPLLEEAKIEVSSRDGLVTISGIVDSYAKKMEAEIAVKKVIGVCALKDTVTVELTDTYVKTDAEIEHNILTALKINRFVPTDAIVVKMEEGWLSLEGTVPWNFQREAVVNTVSYLVGIRGITNNILIKPEMNVVIEQHDVENALNLSWPMDVHDINVMVSGSTVTLNGTVNSWYIKDEAARIVWNTPGICHLINNLEIDHYYALIC